MSRIVGIDLGTTNSVLATVDADGVPRIITSSEGDTKMPSVVAIGPRGEIAVGEPALARVAAGESVFSGVKRLLGRRYEDREVQRLAGALPYEIVPSPNGDAWVSAAGVRSSPPEIAALVLARLRAMAEAHFEATVTEAIITVPAYYDNEQRRATLDAAQIAGLQVRRLLNEPTAAALGYGAHKGENRRIAVCDLGGGTFDVSIVNVEDGVFEVIATSGDSLLGGDDIDRAVMQELIAEVRQRHGYDLAAAPAALQELRLAAQRAKHALSSEPRVELALDGVAELPSGKHLDYRRELTRAELEMWSAPLLSRLAGPCRDALARCGLAPADIGAVILVGGMTRMPAVQRTIGEIFACEPEIVSNPDEVVAVGAAIQSAVLDGTIGGVVLLDVTSRAIELSVDGGKAQLVVPQGATVPTREHKILATSKDGQRELAFDVYEGFADRSRGTGEPAAAGRRHIGRYACGDLPQAPAGEALVMLDFTIDVDGILRVAALELTSGQPVTVRLVATAGLTRADVKRLSESMPEVSAT